MTSSTDVDADIHFHGVRFGFFSYVPGFFYLLILYIVGALFIADPRATFIEWGAYHLSWVEVLLVAAAMVAVGDQMKVSHPGIDNTLEALTMVGMAVVQLVFFVLAAADVRLFSIFGTTEFLMLTLISIVQAVVAILINARTLRRTIGVGDNG